MKFSGLFSRFYHQSLRSFSIPNVLKKRPTTTRESSLGFMLLASSGTFITYHKEKLDSYPFSISEQLKETLSMADELAHMAYRRIRVSMSCRCFCFFNVPLERSANTRRFFIASPSWCECCCLFSVEDS
jgi:hypothetical protein